MNPGPFTSSAGRRISQASLYSQSLRALLLRLGWLGVPLLLLGLVLVEWKLNPSPVWRLTPQYEVTTHARSIALDLDQDGRLERVSKNSMPSFGASLVIHGLGSELGIAGQQFNFAGDSIAGIIGSFRDNKGNGLACTSVNPDGLRLHLLRGDGAGSYQNWDTLLIPRREWAGRSGEVPYLVNNPIPLADGGLWLPITGNYQTWRGSAVVTPHWQLQLYPNGLGMDHGDELTLLDAEVRQSLLCYGRAAGNGNDLAGYHDHHVTLFQLRDGYHPLELPDCKVAFACVFPDRRHVLVLKSMLFEPETCVANVLIWDTWTQDLNEIALVPLGVSRPFREGGAVRFFTGTGGLAEVGPDFRLHLLQKRSRGQGLDLIADPTGSSFLLRQNRRLLLLSRSGEVLVDQPSSETFNNHWVDLDSKGNPLWLHARTPHSPTTCYWRSWQVHVQPFWERVANNPFNKWAMLVAVLLLMLILVIRILLQERMLQGLVARSGSMLGLFNGRQQLIIANARLRDYLRSQPEHGELISFLAGSAMRERIGSRSQTHDWKREPFRIGPAKWTLLTGDNVSAQVENEQQRLFLAKLAVMAHDLKSPLTPIQMQADVLESRLAALPEEDRAAARQSIDAIHEGVDRSLSLIQRFMNMARIEFQTEQVSLPDVIHGAIADCKKGNGIGITFTIDWDKSQAWVASAEPEVLQLVLLELLQNAVQAMEGRGTISIRLIRLPENGIELTLCDTGPGIAVDQLDKVWEPGYTTRARGTGFGLYFVKRVLEQQGIGIELGKGEGGGLQVELNFAPQEGAPDLVRAARSIAG